MAADLQIHGTCDPWFSAVQEVFASHFEQGLEQGAAVCVIVDGRTVVDLWAGTATRGERKPWARNTIVNVYSATKAVSALCLHLLAERGQVDFDAPVAQYWPEFAAQGKGGITVVQMLSHQAGLCAIEKPLPHEAFYTHATVATALAEQKPVFEPCTAHGYHAQTFGFLVGELVRRIAGVSIGTFLRQEITGPRDIDFMIGFGPEHDHRVAQVTRPIGQRPPKGQPDLIAAMQNEPESLTARAFNNPKPQPGAVNTRAFRAAEIPGSNGHGNARALAQLYAAMVGGCGEPLLSPSVLKRCYTALAEDEDLVLRVPTSFASGYLCSRPRLASQLGEGASDQAFGHPGMGGSLGCADPAVGLGFGYTVNRAAASVLIDPRAERLLNAVYDCL